MMHAFNSDAVYQQLFRSHWLAEWAQYNSSQYYAGDDGRYGLGAGPVKRPLQPLRLYSVCDSHCTGRGRQS